MQEDKNAIFQMRFPQKLCYLQCDHSIFKTTNISSFVRQLNLYGFRKVTSHLQDPLCNSSNPYMHEYVHDYFQFGRPELLNKINRKAFKKTYKPKNMLSEEQLSACLTPLQKARRAFRIALGKAAQDIFFENSPKPFYFECEDAVNEYCEDEENVEQDWLFPKTIPGEVEKQPPMQQDQLPTLPKQEIMEQQTHLEAAAISTHRETNEDSPINLTDDSSQQANYCFPNQFLSMPELDVTTVTEANHGVELLAQFNVNDDTDDGIARRIRDKRDSTDTLNYLNCVLPSISHDQIDDISMIERDAEFSAHYNGEWDQMFDDIMANKGPNPECGSDLKELYSQISKTMDLLN